MKTYVGIVLAVGLLCGFQMGAAAATTIPFQDGFESSAPGAPAWIIAGGGTVARDTGQGIEGTYVCIVSNDTLTLTLTPGYYSSNVWVQVYSKPVPSEEEPTVSGVSAAFCLTTNGNLRAYVSDGGDKWETLVGSLDTNAWYGFAAHLDYANTNWDLYYTASSYGAVMAMANSAPLGMPSDKGDELTEFVVESGRDALIDAVVASVGYGTVESGVVSPAHAAGKVNVNMSSFPVGGGMHSGNLGGYFTDDTAANLANDGGAVLLCALSIGDKVHFWDPAAGSFDTFTVVGPSKAWSPSPSGNANQNLKPTTAYWVETSSAGTPECTDETYFAPHDDSTPVAVTLYGTGSSAGGWTAVAWPYAARRQSEGLGWGFPAVSGDTIFVSDTTSGYVMLRYSGSEWTYLGASASYRFAQGQGMWYYRSTGANATWNVQNVE